MKKQAIVNSGVSLLSMTAGTVVSRVVTDLIPIKNNKLKTGGMALLGLIGAIATDGRKTKVQSVVHDMAIASAVTQTGYFIKDMVGEVQNETLKTALGAPDYNWNEPFELDSSGFLSSYTTPNYDNVSEDISFEEVEEFNS